MSVNNGSRPSGRAAVPGPRLLVVVAASSGLSPASINARRASLANRPPAHSAVDRPRRRVALQPAYRLSPPVLAGVLV